VNLLGLAKFGLSDFEQIAIVGVLIAAFISLAYAWFLRGIVMKKDKGTAKMQEVWNAIRIGADSYLSRQLRTILPLIVVLTFVMFFSVYVVPPTEVAQKEFGDSAQLYISIGRAIAFIMPLSR
jgi:K(+)-stimulated pyrophosphate-energized sodium pump